MTTLTKTIQKRIASRGYAFNGLVELIRNEPNARIHLLATALVLILGISLHISLMDWLLVIMAICLVFAAELFNSGLEKLSDFVQPERDPRIRSIKDMAAAAVLLIAVMAIAIGLYVFIPYLIWLL